MPSVQITYEHYFKDKLNCVEKIKPIISKLLKRLPCLKKKKDDPQGDTADTKDLEKAKEKKKKNKIPTGELKEVEDAKEENKKKKSENAKESKKSRKQKSKDELRKIETAG